MHGEAQDGHLDFHTAPERFLYQCCFTSTETIRLIRDGEAQDGHLDFHTAPELRHFSFQASRSHAMATASVPTEPSEKECSVCHEPFTEPKLLPCGHLMCRHCLLSWLKSQKDAKCPLCRGQIMEAEVRGKKSLEEIADGFPTDLAMKMVVDADRVLNKEHSCCVCEDVAATALCLTCGDMLCETCAKAHRKMSMLKYHRVEDLSSLTAEDLAASRPETCPVHADRTSELFCPTHGAAICSLCATISHRSCPEVTSLETKMEEARAVLAELAAMLSAGETELERGISQLDQHLQETEKRTRAAIAEVEAMLSLIHI